MAILLVLLGIWAPLYAISPTLTGHAVEVLPTIDEDPAKPTVLAALAAYRPNGPPAGLHSHINRTPNPDTRVDSDRDVWVIVVVTFRSDHSAVVNWYAYCDGDPVNRWDPSGLDDVVVEGSRVFWVTDGGSRLPIGTQDGYGFLTGFPGFLGGGTAFTNSDISVESLDAIAQNVALLLMGRQVLGWLSSRLL